MAASLIITLRETLEAALIVGIVIGFLKRTNQNHYSPMVWYGVASGTILSVLGALLFQQLAGGFSGRAEELFEGVAMVTGSILVTTLIIWMMRQKNVAGQLRDKVASHVSNAQPWGIFFLVFIAIMREGIETVIFLQSASLLSSDNNLLGGIIGIVVAITLGLLLYRGSLRINLQRFFTITGFILILFAAGLLAHGVHELQEAGALPVFIAEVWNTNPQLIDGSHPPLHENGAVGSFLKGLFGYNGNPTLLEIVIYSLYLLGIAIAWNKLSKPTPKLT